jgi:hypothetical protein
MACMTPGSMAGIDPIRVCPKLNISQMNNLDEENGDKQWDFQG